MKSTIALGLLSYIALSIDSRHNENHLKQSHQGVSNQCCVSQGGILCGKVTYDCCQGSCKKSYFYTTCANQIYTPTCLTCKQICLNNNGHVCGVIVSTGKIDCCALQNCVIPQGVSGGLADKVVNVVGDKVKDYAMSGLGLAHNLGQHHFSLADKLIDKIVGPNSKCKPGTQISVPANCIPDGYLDLLQMRIFGI